MTFSIVTLAVFHEWDVTRHLACPQETFWTGQPASSLSAALVRVRVAGAVTRTHTQGCGPPPQVASWEDFLALADPHIRIAVRASGCRGPEDIEECVQEAWLQVVKRVPAVDPDPDSGSLVCWLQTIPRRSTCRVLLRRARAARVTSLMAAQLPWPTSFRAGDPHQPDPARVFAAQESRATCLDSLETALGERAQRLVRLQLADQSSLTCLAHQLDMTAGQFWHLWRTVKTFLHDQPELLRE